MSNVITTNDLLRDKNALVSHIAETKLSGKRLDKAIQIMLASACLHAHAHGDFDLINDTISALNKGARTNAAREFVERFGPVNWNEKNKNFVFSKKKRIENFEESELFNTMLSTDWTDLKPEAPFRPFDLQAQLAAVLRKAKEAAADQENVGKHKVSVEEIDALQIIYDTMELERKRKEVENAIAAEKPEDEAE